MEHYASTLATTALAVFGLVAAAHSLHPGNYEVRARPAMTSQTVQAAPSAWVDPPARIAAPRAAAEPALDGAGLLAPQMIAVLPPGAAMIPPLPSAITPLAERTRTAEAAPRPKFGRRLAPARHAPAARTAQAGRPVIAQDGVPAPQAAARIDLVGDVLRGLGFGHDG